jgi:hypothetical protein
MRILGRLLYNAEKENVAAILKKFNVLDNSGAQQPQARMHFLFLTGHSQTRSKDWAPYCMVF